MYECLPLSFPYCTSHVHFQCLNSRNRMGQIASQPEGNSRLISRQAISLYTQLDCFPLWKAAAESQVLCTTSSFMISAKKCLFVHVIVTGVQEPPLSFSTDSVPSPRSAAGSPAPIFMGFRESGANRADVDMRLHDNDNYAIQGNCCSRASQEIGRVSRLTAHELTKALDRWHKDHSVAVTATHVRNYYSNQNPTTTTS